MTQAGIELERVSIICDSCHRKLITRKGGTLDRHAPAIAAAIAKHKEAMPDRPHELRAKIDATY